MRETEDSGKVWIMGTSYSGGASNPKLQEAAQSFLRFTYRRDFPALRPYPITSDAGWGCMLRSAQMIMGHAMCRHYFGREWKLPKNTAKLRSNRQYCQILEWFLDYPGYPHIFSMHHIVQAGMRYDKLPGEWFGPSTAALVFRDLAKLHRFRYGGPVEVLVTQGDTIYKSEAETLCSNLTLNDFDAIFDFIKKPNSGRAVSKSVESLNEDNVKTFSEAVKEDPLHVGTSKAPATSVETGDASVLFFDPLLRPPPSLVAPWAHSLVVFVPLRLGINYVNPEYHEEIKEVLRSKHCIGILGGRVGHAIYFVGYRDSSTLLGLDPHTVFKNPAKPSSSGNPLTRDSTAVVHINYDGNSNQSSDTSGDFVTDEYINQIHVKDFVSLDISQLDPSLAIGFYFSDREDFEQFYEEVKLANELKIVAGRTPLFTVGNSPPSFLDEDLWNIDRASTINGKGSADLDDGKDEDEYVFL